MSAAGDLRPSLAARCCTTREKGETRSLSDLASERAIDRSIERENSEIKNRGSADLGLGGMGMFGRCGH